MPAPGGAAIRRPPSVPATIRVTVSSCSCPRRYAIGRNPGRHGGDPTSLPGGGSTHPESPGSTPTAIRSERGT
ncbi:hypothetical protein NKG94_25920 [Micromonospora sp. M12]